jgi:hypothetical protein
MACKQAAMSWIFNGAGSFETTDSDFSVTALCVSLAGYSALSGLEWYF